MNWLPKIFKTSTASIEPLANKDLTVVWIHGANQSSQCWSYLREKISAGNEILINYSSMNRFHDNLEHIKDQIGKKRVFVVGHSLGGLYALHLVKSCNVAGVVSISTPYRGSSAADWAKYIVPNYALFKDIGRKSRPVLEGDRINISIPYTQIVSTHGSVPYLNGENDGVVTVASMTHRSGDMETVRVAATHYEVMVSDTVAGIISERYNQIKD